MAKIIIVEDDKDLNDGITYALSMEGHLVTQAYGDKVIQSFNFDLAILDVNLPLKSGFELAHDFKCPKLFLTANDTEKDMLRGFELGCEDYVTKPFSLAILLEKIKVILRRVDKQSCYAYNHLVYNREACLLEVKGEVIALSKREHQILDVLIHHRGKIVTKAMLLEAVWDKDGDFVNEGTVNVNVNRLRKKMDPDGKWIQTVFGIGYKWCES